MALPRRHAALPPRSPGHFPALHRGARLTSRVGKEPTAAFGIGGGLILLAVMAMLMPPAALIPVHGIVQIGSNFGRMLVLIRHVDWSLMPGFILGATVGAGIGGSVAVNIPESAVLIGVGFFVIWSLLGFAFGPWLAFIVAMIGLGFVGTVLGRQVLRKIDDARFYRVLSAILLLLALRLIWQGASIALAG